MFPTGRPPPFFQHNCRFVNLSIQHNTHTHSNTHSQELRGDVTRAFQLSKSAVCTLILSVLSTANRHARTHTTTNCFYSRIRNVHAHCRKSTFHRSVDTERRNGGREPHTQRDGRVPPTTPQPTPRLFSSCSACCAPNRHQHTTLCVCIANACFLHTPHTLHRCSRASAHTHTQAFGFATVRAHTLHGICWNIAHTGGEGGLSIAGLLPFPRTHTARRGQFAQKRPPTMGFLKLTAVAAAAVVVCLTQLSRN